MLKLRPYQAKGAEFLSHHSVAILGDDPRLGKCCQTIRACEDVDAQMVIVVCPASVRETWAREFEKWSTRPWQVHTKFGSRGTPGDRHVYVASYEDVTSVFKEALARLRPDVLVIDEAHYIKNSTSLRAKAIYGTKHEPGLAQNTKRVWLLSGTIMPNNPSELYPHVRVLFPQSFLTKDGKPMDKWTFEHKYCTFKNNGFGEKITGGKNLEDLRTRLKPHMLRRTQEEVWPQMPKIQVENLYLDAHAELKRLTDKETSDYMEKFADLFAAADEKAQQNLLENIDKAVEARARRLLGLAKVPSLVKWIEQRFESGGGKLVLFAHHRDVMDAFADAFDANRTMYLRLDGRTPAEERQRQADIFQDPADDREMVFLGQIQAAGVGIDLSAADEVVFAEYSWVPGDNVQPMNRVRNINKNVACMARFAIVSGSYDERMTSSLAKKTETIKEVIG